MQAKTKRMLLGLAVLLALAVLALALYYNVPRKIALEVPAVVLTDWPDQEDVELLEQTTLRISGTWSPGIRDRDITLESVVVDGTTYKVAHNHDANGVPTTPFRSRLRWTR